MRIGILGGGQLARMLALAGYPLGLEFVFYDASADCCAADLGPVIVGDFQNPAALAKFLAMADVVTYENENIPVVVVNEIAYQKPLHPNTAVLQVSQDRLLEKQLFQKLGIATANFYAVSTPEDLILAGRRVGYPYILKTRREGYDGKGQFKIHSELEAENFNLISSKQGYIAEELIAFSREVSMIAARSISGQIVYYDLCENVHQNGILVQTHNKVSDPLFGVAKQYINQVLQNFNYVGILVIEFFVKENHLIANEMAPRVHNSGHWTIEGAVTSQFENHLRAILDYPLGVTKSCGQATMLNLLTEIPDKSNLLQIPHLHLHDYHKQARANRKVGHITIVSEELTQVQQQSIRVQKIITPE